MNKSCGTLLYSQNGYGCEDVALGGYVSLMDLYENNYIRFRKLVARLGELGASAVSKVDGCHDLHLEVLERSRYTTTVCLTYRFIEGSLLHVEPNLVCRVYHDACLVEVLAGNLKHGRQHLDHLGAGSLKMKWRLNRFLYKWLGFCLHLGHAFDMHGCRRGGRRLR
jgi:uncharacterized protein YqiB (DUF1249 family)